MNLSDDQIQALLRVVSCTRENELTCDECLMQLGSFAELTLKGRPAEEATTSSGTTCRSVASATRSLPCSSRPWRVSRGRIRVVVVPEANRSQEVSRFL